MDDTALQERLRAIERRQYLVIALLVVPYLVGAAELFGYWSTTVIGVALVIVGLALLVVRRRQQPRSETQ